MSSSRGIQLSFAVIFLVLGIVAAVQYRSTKENDKLKLGEQKAIQDVQAQLIREKENSEGLIRLIDEKQKKIDEYQKSSDVSDILKKDLENARILAGLSDVKGKGIIVTLSDSNTTGQNNLDGDNEKRVVDSDILLVVNELRAAGAQAISINKERVTTATEIREIEPFIIRINNQNQHSPFEIKAIGDPDKLQNSLKIRSGVVDQIVQKYGINVNIKQDNNIFIEKYKGSFNLDLLKQS